MALDGYMRITGAHQGPIEGDVKRPGSEGTIAMTSFDHSVGSVETDGHLRPIHRPVVVTKEVDRATPRLARAYATQEPLTEVVLQFVRLSQWGQEEHVYTVELHDARLRRISQEMPDTRSPVTSGHRMIEHLMIGYGAVEMRWELDEGSSTSIPWPGQSLS